MGDGREAGFLARGWGHMKVWVCRGGGGPGVRTPGKNPAGGREGDLGGPVGGRPQARDPGGTAGEQGGTKLRAQGAGGLSPQSKVLSRPWAGQGAVSCSAHSPCLPRPPPSTEAPRAPHTEVAPEPPGLSLVGARLRGAVLSSGLAGGGGR